MNRTINTITGREIYATERVLMRFGYATPLLFLCRCFADEDVKTTYKRGAICFSLVEEKRANYPSYTYNYIGRCTDTGIIDRGAMEVEYAAI